MRSAFLSILMLLPLVGCAASLPYYERYELTHLTVVFVDQQTLRDRYESLYGKPALMLDTADSSDAMKSVKGFFDYRTNTIYCSKLDFTVCGHELHHALLGRFHAE